MTSDISYQSINPPSRRRGVFSIVAGTLVTSILGASYAYSAYKVYLEKLWGSSFWAAMPFSVFILTFSFSSIIGGRVYDKKGIKTSIFLSIFFVFLGLLLSALLVTFSNPLFIVFTYGVLTGLGNGLGYVPVVAMARKWFPDRAGLVTGVVIFGYGGSAMLFAPLKTWLLGSIGLTNTFTAVAFISLLLGIPAYLLIKDPSPSILSYYSKFSGKRIVLPRQDLDPVNVVKTLDYWFLWVSYVMVSGAGLMLIGHLIPFAKLRGLSSIEAAIAVSIFSAMNALGRPPAGWVSDKIGRYGRPITMTILFTIQSLIFIALAYIGSSLIEIYLLVAIAGFIYGSALALYPAATGDFFGLKHLSMNYALVFTGWGISGLIFPSLGGYIKDVTGGYEVALIVFGVVSLIGSIICSLLVKRLKIYID